METYDVVLLERPDDEGLTRDECTALFDKMDSEEVYFVEIPNTNGTSFATGIISTAAANKLDYDLSELTIFICRILDDMNLESADGEYEFNGLSIYMSR